MRLTLSRNSLLNAVYHNEQGQAIYKVHSPFKLVNRTSTISRIVPRGIPSSNSSTTEDDCDLVPVAQIDWNIVNPAWIRFGLVDMDVKAYFREGNWGPFGR
jgi:hypothetical protein